MKRYYANKYLGCLTKVSICVKADNFLPIDTRQPMSYIVYRETTSGKVTGESMSAVVKLCFNDLVVTAENVARYAGGIRYRPDRERKMLAERILAYASSLIQPAFAYTIQDINTLDPHKSVILYLSPERLDAATVFIVATVCTIGPELEKETAKLLAEGKYLDALFLDAAGVALLEALSDKAHSYLEEQAAKESLFAGCRFGPGYDNIPLKAQKFLLESVNSETSGVQMKTSGMLFPLKSLSFWVMWTSSPPEAGTCKCNNCRIDNCAYRIAAQPGTATKQPGPC